MEQPTILDYIYQAHRLLSEMEAKPRDYGTGDLLFASDIHTVVAVAEREGSNLTEIAVSLGISVPAAFKFTTKMVRLGYLSKQKQIGNAKEVVFFLNDSGRRVVQIHTDYERSRFGPLRAYEEQLPEADRRVIRDFLAGLHQRITW